jgi:hypothetical protein
MAKEPKPTILASVEITPELRRSREIYAFNDAVRSLRRDFLRAIQQHPDETLVLTIGTRESN